MTVSHYHALLIGYGVAMISWLAIARIFPNLWPRQNAQSFSHPWREVAWALLALLAVLAIGQLYTRGWLLPASGTFKPIIDAFNQVLIFSPLLLLLLFRRQSLKTAWLPADRIWVRLLIGLAIALIAILVFSLARTGSDSWVAILPRVYHPKNISHLVQVLLEDIAIAILFVRFRSALGLRVTIVLVAVLFAAGHIPALLAGGATLNEMSSLFLDAGLGVGVLTVLQRSADVWWFWCVHFAMDMMQFYAVS
ncbi:MAG: hypothetical protein L0229_11715 [Blastocatellia bacterium]|nr:hypothetical protein [Blastocatellia bacterium]